MLSKRDMVIQGDNYLEHSYKTLSTVCICYHNVLLNTIGYSVALWYMVEFFLSLMLDFLIF